MRLAEAIDLFRRRTYDRLDKDVKAVYVNMKHNEPTYKVIVDTQDAYGIAWTSEKLKRLFGDVPEVKIDVMTPTVYVRHYADYTVLGEDTFND